jgi:hypothetical protein
MHMRRSLYLIPIVTAGLFAAAACNTSTIPGPRVSPRKTGEVREGIEAGMRAPDIKGVDADGKTFQLSDYRGKVVLIDFWAGW